MKGIILANITDPFWMSTGKKSPNYGYIINAMTPIVYQGDAVYHISKL
jgi:hypothetical protein